MRDEHVDELIDLYALGILEPSDEARADEHLETCAACRDLLAERKRIVDLLAFTPDQLEPPPALEQKVLHRFEQTRRSMVQTASPQRWYQRLPFPAWLTPTPAMRGVTLVALVLLVVLGAWNIVLQWRVNTLSAELDDQEKVVEMLRTLGARMVALAPQPDAPSARANLIVNPRSNDAYLVTDGLPVLPGDKAYQIWLQQGDKRVSGGIFRVDSRGSATLFIRSPQPLVVYSGCGITIEPAGGSEWPTGARVLRSASWKAGDW